MAKVGEGDARWIVSDREDGTNVNAWHWQETDVLSWSQKRITEEFLRLNLNEDPRGDFKITVRGEEVRAEGEAYVNTRKGKLIVGYEMKVSVPFTASREGKDAVEGKVEFPYVGDENADEDAELTVNMGSGQDRDVADAAKREILTLHKKKLVGAMNDFVKVLSKGGPALEKQGPGGASPKGTTAAEAAAPKPSSAPAEKPKEKPKPKPSSDLRGKSVELKEEFYCRPSDLYECYMDPGRVQAYTRSEARIVPKAGEEFSLFGGSITGKQVEIVPNERIVQLWRNSSWPQGVLSRVEITFSSPSEGKTVMKLKQTGIPEEDDYGNANTVDVTLQGWRMQIWGRVRQCFGYGC
ncbi:activator of heat shock protein ATPase [Chloropicon primus]|uniref:Activator of heat shock protein ATPase n=2 Tax=Chloropicon primus TaxID=1764295 RepID=A0A5B8MQS3_9CHLO|nr:activator of heat shock protein ATPase [Chloropicon primus]UPR02049.1 activator of heat shock protein ATPase [Chloropicon primus]|eukprot:QDZ22826.1 activator of heat shock protein ATPase [Chloropicon primus]